MLAQTLAESLAKPAMFQIDFGRVHYVSNRLWRDGIVVVPRDGQENSKVVTLGNNVQLCSRKRSLKREKSQGAKAIVTKVPPFSASMATEQGVQAAVSASEGGSDNKHNGDMYMPAWPATPMQRRELGWVVLHI